MSPQLLALISIGLIVVGLIGIAVEAVRSIRYARKHPRR